MAEHTIGTRERMGWRFPYVSTHNTDFPFDFGLALSEEQAQRVPEIKQLVAAPPEWLDEWSHQVGAEQKDEYPDWRRAGRGRFVNTGLVADRNVLGGELEPCGSDPLTGFYRDGCCRTGPEDRGSHTICAVVTVDFLEHQRQIGNDLMTPLPVYGFPGLEPGDRWCVTALNWLRAHEDGSAAYVVLASTHERALEVVPLEALRAHAVDVPPDPGPFGG